MPDTPRPSRPRSPRRSSAPPPTSSRRASGWAAVDDPEHTFCRRWIRRPDRMIDDPFGKRTVRANMHPGYENPDAIAPSGPGRPGADRAVGPVPLGTAHRRAGQLLDALLRRATGLGRLLRPLRRGPGPADRRRGSTGSSTATPFVAIMSQGTSGDQMWMDYGRPKKDPGLDAYADAVAASAERAYRAITYRDHVPLAMAETTLVLGRRVPDEARLAWARGVVAAMKDRDLPRTLPEVYAREAIYLHDEPRRELKLQAIRVGELGITAIPNEVYAITGLKIKAQSPLRPDDEHRAGQRLRGLHPAPRAARPGRLHDLAGAHRRAGGPGRAEDRRGRAEAPGAGRGPAPASVAGPEDSLRRGRAGFEADGLLAARRHRGDRRPRFQRPRAARHLRGRLLAVPAGPRRPRALRRRPDRSRRPISPEAASRPRSTACPRPIPSSSGSGTARRRACLGAGTTSPWCATAGGPRSTSMATRRSTPPSPGRSRGSRSDSSAPATIAAPASRASSTRSHCTTGPSMPPRSPRTSARRGPGDRRCRERLEPSSLTARRGPRRAS